jgi:DNA adenine methylase
MKYMGSKNKYAKDLLKIILKNRLKNQWYVEPFAGGFNIIDKVDGKRIANDINYYLIELFKAIQNGWIPPDEISETEYKDIRNNMDRHPDHLIGFVGFGCSYAGKWFGGYARGKNSKGQNRNYCLESKKNILKQKDLIKDIIIKNENYLDLYIPENSIIYCDPPYESTTSYKTEFDHNEFWEWVRTKSKNNYVFVSEYKAPDDFVCVWEKTVNNSLTKNTGQNKGTEKLFILKNKRSD